MIRAPRVLTLQGFTQAGGMAIPLLFYDAWLYVLLLPPTQWEADEG